MRIGELAGDRQARLKGDRGERLRRLLAEGQQPPTLLPQRQQGGESAAAEDAEEGSASEAGLA